MHKTQRRVLIILAGVILLGLGLRGIFFFQFSRTPFYRYPTLDALDYKKTALNVANGRLIQDRAFFLGPAYPYLLGAAYTLTGGRIWTSRALVLLLWPAIAILIYMVGTKTFGPARGLLGALLYAAHTPALFYEQTLLMEGTLSFFVLLFVTLWLLADKKERPAWYAAAGVALGICAVFRGNFLLFVPAAMAMLFIPRPEGKNNNPLKMSALKNTLIFAGATALAILPATIHNYLAEKDFVLLTSNGGINLFIGNSENATGAFETPPGVDMAVEMTGRRQAEQALGRSPLKSSEISRWWRNRAIASMSRNPLRVVKLAFAKMRYFWGRPDLGQVYSLDHMGQVMPAMKWPLFSGALLGPLALAGLVLAFMQKNVKGRTASGFVLLYMISLLPFFMTARYRLPVAGLLCLLSAHAAISFVESLRSREWFRAAALGVGIALAAFLLNNHSLVRDRMSREGFYNSLGLMRQMDGDLEGARREFETALQEREIPKIRVNLGRVHHLQRDLEGALTCYIKALKSEPQNGRSHFYAGQCLVELGRNDEALPHLESAAVQDPDPPPLLWYNLAFLQLEQGRHSEASENMARYLLARPEDIQAADLFRKMGGGLNAIPVTKPEGAKP